MSWYKKAEIKNTDDIIYDIFRAVEDAVGGNWRVAPITEQKDSKIYWLQRIVSFALYGKSIIKQGDSFAIYVRLWVKRASGKVIHPWDGTYEGASNWDEGQLSKPTGDFNEQAAEHRKRWEALYNMKPDDGSRYDSEYGNRLFEIQIKLYGSKPDISGKGIPHDDRISITSELDTPDEIASHIKSEINRFYFGGDDDGDIIEPFDPTGGGYAEIKEIYNTEEAPVLAPNFAHHKNWYKKAQTYQQIVDDPETYSDPDDPQHFESNKYFSIGQNEDSEDNYCWIWNGREMRTRKGGTHAMNFSDLFSWGKEDPNIYRGWADPSQKLISVVMPRLSGQVDPALSPSSLPTKLRVILGDYFPGYDIKVF